MDRSEFQTEVPQGLQCRYAKEVRSLNKASRKAKNGTYSEVGAPPGALPGFGGGVSPPGAAVGELTVEVADAEGVTREVEEVADAEGVKKELVEAEGAPDDIMEVELEDTPIDEDVDVDVDEIGGAAVDAAVLASNKKRLQNLRLGDATRRSNRRWNPYRSSCSRGAAGPNHSRGTDEKTRFEICSWDSHNR
ncbi:hypothetical protein M427DRAFT_45368 [Gonapodya prolifera JEL478]|uniref:Uncharacterized protein n=1 Tax=Gonapodya prolifera (strain JEL478) TaxID=1344416 RepID=A0A139AAU7_GONPJ|nr:hypothetical protein M427DRAFT_45368 [Gonapodya prolifera JEL478]|eukprot:KXS13867.1 hypothetical protein M427DRAFT_45368 [Gonapodya prolifera JEL478]